jgi:quinoprotein glucose dehydrogenase
MRRFAADGLALVGACFFALATLSGQNRQPPGEWRTYGGDLASTRYAPLDQIDRTNFSKLEVAWRFKTDALGPRPEFNLQSTPLMIGGVLYSTGGTRR